MISIPSIAFPSAVSAALVFMLARRFVSDVRMAFWASLGISAGTIFWPYSNTFYGHALSASCLFMAFYIGFQRVHHTVRRKSAALLLLGLLLGFAFITEYSVAVIIIWILGYAVSRAGDLRSAIRTLGLIGLGSLPPILLAVGYDYAAFGRPFTSGYAYSLNQVFRAEHSRGLLGIGPPNLGNVLYMTIHPGVGILWFSPVLLLALPGAGEGRAEHLSTREHHGPRNCCNYTARVFRFLFVVGWFVSGTPLPNSHAAVLLDSAVLALHFVQAVSESAPIVSSIGMFIVASTTIFVPHELVEGMLVAPPFAFSTFYSYVLPRFLVGNLADNLASMLVVGPGF